MLLIAQPKSASTSLAHTIAKTCNLKLNLGIPGKKRDINCPGFQGIQRYHCNMVERGPLFIKQVVSGRKTLFKDHLLPIDKHLRRLEKIRKPIIILLRNPADSYDSYYRLFKKSKKKFDEVGVMNDLKLFHDRYILWDAKQPNTKIIFYRDLICNYVNTMKMIYKFYGIKPRGIRPLIKYKHTGVGAKRIKDAIKKQSNDIK